MAQSWLQDALVNGTNWWDITILSLLSIVMMSALDCRSGDMIRASGYRGNEYMRFEHITLKLAGDGSARFENLVALVPIAYQKGQK